MTSFADARLLAMVGCLAIALAPPPEGAWRGAVAERVAALWRVAPESVRLEWGRVPAGADGIDAPMRIVGGGIGGWFTAVIGAGDSAVAVRVRAGTAESVRVAARPLERGTILSDDDLGSEARVRWGPPATAAEAPGIGWEVRRPIAAGELITPPAVAPPPLIRSGDPIRMTWSRGGVSVTRVGVAMNSARRGERVHARFEGRTQLEGTAREAGVATLPGGEP